MFIALLLSHYLCVAMPYTPANMAMEMEIAASIRKNGGDAQVWRGLCPGGPVAGCTFADQATYYYDLEGDEEDSCAAGGGIWEAY
jgi:hypothetical protein